MAGGVLDAFVEPILARVIRDAKEGARTALLRATVVLIAAIAFATGIVFCAWAAYSALAAALSPAAAGVIVGIVLLLASTLTLWRVLARPRPEPVSAARAADVGPVPPEAEIGRAHV